MLDYDSVLFSLPAPPILVYLPPLCESALTETYFNIFLKSVKLKNYKNIIINLVSTGRGKFILLTKCFLHGKNTIF